ncbi:hypothetical protein Tco_1386968 [Tanacetum coccineum]
MIEYSGCRYLHGGDNIDVELTSLVRVLKWGARSRSIELSDAASTMERKLESEYELCTIIDLELPSRERKMSDESAIASVKQIGQGINRMARRRNDNLKTTQEQVVEDAHVIISTVTKKTEVPVTSSSCSSVPHADAEIVSPLDVHVHHEVPRTQAPTLLIIQITALEKEVAELKKDPLHTHVTTLVDEHLDTRSLTDKESKSKVKDQLHQFLPKIRHAVPQDQEGNPRYDFEECYKALSEKLDWENPKGGDYPFDLSKPIPLITRGKRQRVQFEYFINNDLKYLQGGVSTMTYTTSTAKTNAAKS